MQRIITWHIPVPGAPLPAFYMERDYNPLKVRIYASLAPAADCEIDIRDDGTSIFNERALRPEGKGVSRLVGTAKNSAVLPKGANLEEQAEDFPAPSLISAGSVLTCHEIESGGAANVTVQLELVSLDDEEEDTD